MMKLNNLKKEDKNVLNDVVGTTKVSEARRLIKKADKMGIDPIEYFETFNKTSSTTSLAVVGRPFSDEYIRGLVARSFHQDFFEKRDGAIYSLAKNFYEAKYVTVKSAVRCGEIAKFYQELGNLLSLDVNNNFELIKARKITQSLKNGIRMVDGLYKRSIVKECAWGATHAYLAGFLTDQEICRIIPGSASSTTVKKWNYYINKMNDVPSQIKELFVIHPEDGMTIFGRMVGYITATTRTQQQYEYEFVDNVKKEEPKTEMAVINHPVANTAKKKDVIVDADIIEQPKHEPKSEPTPKVEEKKPEQQKPVNNTKPKSEPKVEEKKPEQQKAAKVEPKLAPKAEEKKEEPTSNSKVEEKHEYVSKLEPKNEEKPTNMQELKNSIPQHGKGKKKKSKKHSSFRPRPLPEKDPAPKAEQKVETKSDAPKNNKKDKHPHPSYCERKQKAAADHPQDDQTFDEVDVVKSIDLDKQYKTAVDLDDAKDDAAATKEEVKAAEEITNMKLAIEPIKEVGFGKVVDALIFNDDPKCVDNPEEEYIDNQIEQDLVADEDPYKVNNKAYEQRVHKLVRFTNLVHSVGCKVIYNQNQSIPGLIDAIIEKDGEVINTLGIDNYTFYGDNLRIVTRYGDDIRREVFIPVSMDDIVKKAICQRITNRDNVLVTNQISKFVTDARYKYMFLDRIDMSGLHYKDKQGNERQGLPFHEWIDFVDNINEVIFDKDLPNIRWRIGNYSDPNHFTLLADPNVRYPFNSAMLEDKNNLLAAAYGSAIVFDGDNITSTGKHYQMFTGGRKLNV